MKTLAQLTANSLLQKYCITILVSLIILTISFTVKRNNKDTYFIKFNAFIPNFLLILLFLLALNQLLDNVIVLLIFLFILVSLTVNTYFGYIQINSTVLIIKRSMFNKSVSVKISDLQKILFYTSLHLEDFVIAFCQKDGKIIEMHYQIEKLPSLINKIQEKTTQ